MIKLYFPKEVIIGLSSVIPIAKFITGNKYKKVAIVYKKKRFPWKLFCLCWSLGFRLTKTKVINFNSKKKVDKFNHKDYDAIVCLGDKNFIDEIKLTRECNHFITIEEGSGTLYGLSSIIYDQYNGKLIKDIKYIPELAYDNYRKKFKLTNKVYAHLFANLSIAITTYLYDFNQILNTLSFKAIRTLNSLISFYKIDNYKKLKYFNRRRIKTTLAQLDQIIYTILNNCNDNKIVNKIMESSINYDDFEKKLTKDFLQYFTNFIIDMKKKKVSNTEYRFNKCDLYDWDKLDKIVRDFYNANIHI